MAPPSGKKLEALLRRAEAFAQAGNFEAVLGALQGFPASGGAISLRAEAFERLGRLDEAWAEVVGGLKVFPADVELSARAGFLLVARGQREDGLRALARIRHKLERSSTFLARYALVLLDAGRWDDAESVAASASVQGGFVAKVAVATVAFRKGRYESALSTLKSAVQGAPGDAARILARHVEFNMLRVAGRVSEACVIVADLHTKSALRADFRARAAVAAFRAGERALAQELQPSGQAVTLIEERLAWAEHELWAGRVDSALDALVALSLDAASMWDGGVECMGWMARARRFKGQTRAALDAAQIASVLPAATLPWPGKLVLVELGHGLAESGDLEQAETTFARCLALAPGDQEALMGQDMVRRRLKWARELKDQVKSEVAAAHAKENALSSQMKAQADELASLRKELARLRKAQEVLAAQKDAERESSVVGRSKKMAEEMAAREADVDAKAQDNIDLALASVEGLVHPALRELLLVAEKTYQKALYTELPAAAVAVLFSGALERTLHALYVEAFEAWLSAKAGRREAFLKAATRERRGKRVEYIDNFSGAFDRDGPGRTPTLGEVGRALERRHSAALVGFAQFLEETYALEDAAYDDVARFVLSSKERLRDPVAHGRAIEVTYDELKGFREVLLFRFGDRGLGFLALCMKRAPA